MKVLISLLLFAQSVFAAESYSGRFIQRFDSAPKLPIFNTLTATYKAIGGNVPGYLLAIDGKDSGTLWRNADVLEGYSRNSDEYLSFVLYLKPSAATLARASCDLGPVSQEELKKHAVLKAVKYDERNVDWFCVRLN